jgi:hypothetical protein
MSTAVRQSLPILSLVIAGFLFKQVGLLRSGDGQVMARLIINLTLPAVIFLSIAQANVSPARMALLAVCGVIHIPVSELHLQLTGKPSSPGAANRWGDHPGNDDHQHWILSLSRLPDDLWAGRNQPAGGI